jgi:predicted RNA-binding Zn ribbon-like protein
MKKALHDIEEVSLFKINGEIHSDELSIDEILDAVNRGLKGDVGDSNETAKMLRKLHQWISRYIEEGTTEKLYYDLNADLQHVRYSKSVSSDSFPSEDGNSKGKYIADLTKGITSEECAAKEFSRIITDRLINRLKRCKGFDCENVFFGPPQAKWCSKTCGSKYRVREKRKRDSS